MSLKDDLKAVRDELNSEEKFLENAIKTERFVKKYKTPLIVASVVAVVGIVANVAFSAYNDNIIEKSNIALYELLEDSTNENAKTLLKETNPKLYDLWSMSNSIFNGKYEALSELKNSKSNIVSDIAEYESAISSGDMKSLQEYIKKQDAIYKDLAIIEIAIDLIDKNEISKAHEKLAMIDKSSSIYSIAEMLMHYGIK